MPGDRQPSLIARLAEFFRHHPCAWIDGRELACIGGQYAWRTRVSELRRSPYSMTIENRQRTAHGPAGVFTISEYRFVPEATTAASQHDRPLLQVAE